MLAARARALAAVSAAVLLLVDDRDRLLSKAGIIERIRGGRIISDAAIGKARAARRPNGSLPAEPLTDVARSRGGA